MKFKDFSKVLEFLGLTEREFEQRLEKNDIVKVNYDGFKYYRFREAFRKVEKGTVIVLDPLTIVRGYPKIPRAFVISSAFKKRLSGEKVFAEEKMDGYNVRTVMLKGKLYSFTRRGLYCPYTTLRIRHQLESDGSIAFFEENPELMLCGEVVGLQNPYQEKSYPEAREFGYFVFDIRNMVDNSPVSYDEKLRLVEKYGLKHVNFFGEVSSGEEVLKLVRKLGEDGREGVVLKSFDGMKMLKYTANQSTNNDLKYAFTFFEDYGLAFMYSRVLREAFQAYELGLEGKELEKEAKELGKSILIPMVETIKRIAEGEEVTEDFELLVPSEEFGFKFVENLKNLGVIVTVKEKKKTSKGVKFKLSRHYPKTNDKTKAILEGACADEW